MSFLIETLEDKLRFELGARDFEILALKDQLEKANKTIAELQEQLQDKDSAS